MFYDSKLDNFSCLSNDFYRVPRTICLSYERQFKRWSENSKIKGKLWIRLQQLWHFPWNITNKIERSYSSFRTDFPENYLARTASEIYILMEPRISKRARKKCQQSYDLRYFSYHYRSATVAHLTQDDYNLSWNWNETSPNRCHATRL